MNLSPLTKVGLAFGALVAFILFLIVVDLGVNAGRIHYGASVAGEDLGGMTRVEAREVLEERGEEVRKDLVIQLTAVGLNDAVRPSSLGWRPGVSLTLRKAYGVGREDAPFGALADRAGAWLWGIKVELQGRFDTELLNEKFDEWDEWLTALGTPLDREALRDLLRRAVGRGEPVTYEFPVEGGEG